jgi:RimJ/RimL family protein N-acetyltransferase
MNVRLRDVRESDIELFHRFQADPESAAMADFKSRDRETSFTRWREIMADESITVRAIVVDDRGEEGIGDEGGIGGEVVAGHIVSWLHDGVRELGYWIDRPLWGRGVATAALLEFLAIVTDRPVYAWTAPANVGSQRVLEKGGFVYERDDDGFRLYRLS